MKNILKLLFLLPLVLLLSCMEAELDVEQMIDQAVQKKLDNFKNKKRKDCIKYIQSKAEEYVDSVMYLEIGINFSESMNLPKRPARPLDSLRFKIDMDTTDSHQTWVDTNIVN
jgi:hypothetical protein